MAASSFHTQQQSLMECPVCTESFDLNNQLPHVFPCMHSLCRECLSALLARTPASVSCLVCRKATPTPNGVQSVSVNFSLRDTLEVLLKHRPAASTASAKSSTNELCSECADAEEAAMFCTACCACLCDFHVTAHRKPALTKAHTIVDVTEMKRSSSLRSPTKRRMCAKHPTQEIDMFCIEDQVAICPKCFIVDHRHHEVEDLVTVFGNEKQALMTHLAKACTYLSDLKQEGKNRSHHSAQVCQAIKDSFGAMMVKLREREKTLLAAEEKLMDINSIQASIASMRQHIDEAENMAKTEDMVSLLMSKRAIAAKLEVACIANVRSEYNASNIPDVNNIGVVKMKSAASNIGSLFPASDAPQARGASFGVPPSNIISSRDGLIYIIDCDNHRVQVFRRDGTFIRKWGSYGNGDGQFSRPYGITYGSDGLLYVTDNWNYRVQVFVS